MDTQTPNPAILVELVRMKMPFGKYEGTLLYKLPVNYLEWFQRKGFPKGKIGIQLATLYEIRLNGLDDILKTLAEKYAITNIKS